MRPDRLRFVTGNPGKVRELQGALQGLGITVEQADLGYPEIQAASLEEVAAAGADALLAAGLEPPFALEDSGLFVSALGGFPGVYSRHALETIGCVGILRLLQDVELESRGAAFQAHLRYVDADGQQHGFHGICKGRIAARAAGSGGFGFDPIFVPDGHERTFAELPAADKNSLSHRGQAAHAFSRWLGKTVEP